MSGNHIIVESGGVIYVIGPREGHTWHDHKGMWEVCKIDNAVMWESPEDEAVDRANARKIRDGLNSYASSQAEIERLRAALKPFADWPMERGRRDEEIYLGSTVGNVTFGDFERARTALSGGKP